MREVDRLYNAGVSMQMAEGAPDHRERADHFMRLFDAASAWVRVQAAVRVVRWIVRNGRERRRA